LTILLVASLVQGCAKTAQKRAQIQIAHGRQDDSCEGDLESIGGLAEQNSG
jgi:hypothetical protein